MRELFGRIGTAVRALIHRGAFDRDMDEELATHLALRAADLVRAGLPLDDAMRRARLEFGNVTANKEWARESWGTGATDRLLQDVRYAMRVFRRNPGFTAVAVLSLGFGIGATTTMFSVIDTLDVRPLPYPRQDRLVWLAEVAPLSDRTCPACGWPTSPATALSWIAQSRTLDVAAVVGDGALSWSPDDVVESLPAKRATPGLFSLLGVRPFLGRDFQMSDTAAGAEPVIVVSHEFWRTRLGADTAIVGQRLLASVDRGADPVLRGVTVIGVLPPGFNFAGHWAVWTPMRLSATARHDDRFVVAVGRLKDGVSIDAASAELRLLTARIAAGDSSSFAGWGTAARPLRDTMMWSVGRGRFILFAITLLVLLIAMLNVAGLQLGRTSARLSEFAMRTALGASRWRLIRQQLVEGGCIGVAGGVVALLFAVPATRFASNWFAVESSGLAIRLDWRLLTFAAAVSLIVGAGVAILPGLRVARADLGGNLRERGSTGAHRTATVSGALITAQLAMALLLVAAATLLSADFIALRYADLGYDPRELHVIPLSPPRAARTDPQTWLGVAEMARDRVAHIAGVRTASLRYRSAMHPAIVTPDGGRPTTAGQRSPVLQSVDTRYLDTWNIRLLAGRWFGSSDNAGAARVAVVNKTAAAQFWPGQDAIGKLVFLGDSIADGELLTVIGVTRDVERGEMVERHWPTVYRPLSQAKVYHASVDLFVRVDESTAATLNVAQAVVRDITRQTGAAFESDEQRLSRRFASRRLTALVLDVFAAFGLVLAAMGIYGSIAYAVTRRTREIGVRVALGADRSSVLRLIAGRGVRLALVGSAIGICGALAMTRVLRPFVAATSPTNPWVPIAAGVLMILTALVATYLPARRAMQVDPMTALREE